MKAVLCGPPHSGKSCLREGVKEAVGLIQGAPYCYVITAAPDGEGAWYQKTVRHNPERAKELKATYKAEFTSDFVRRVADAVRNCQQPLTIVDIGGIPDEKNKTICAGATHVILLARAPSQFQEWRDFCNEADLQIVAEIWSDYDGDVDHIDENDRDLLMGSVHHLERGEPVADRPMVRALARHLVALATSS